MNKNSEVTVLWPKRQAGRRGTVVSVLNNVATKDQTRFVVKLRDKTLLSLVKSDLEEVVE